MRSASLFSHCHFRISTHSSHIPPRPPPYWSTLSQSSSSSHFFPLTICLNDSITLTSKVWSICLRMQEVMLSCVYIEFSHIFHIKEFYHPLMQLLALAKRQLLPAHPSYEESIHPRWQKNKGNIFLHYHIDVHNHTWSQSTHKSEIWWCELTLSFSRTDT